MHSFEAQATLFAPKASRLALVSLDLSSTLILRRSRVNVWRNHGFESIASLAAPYFTYIHWQVDFHLSAYDDSLSFEGHPEADAELLWLDSSRIQGRMPFSTWLEWLQGRLETLRNHSRAPIILATWGSDLKETQALQVLTNSLPAVLFADISTTCADAQVALLDPRSAQLAGTPVSKAAQVVLARKLACHWLSGVLLPPIKALVLDLDNTLHAGVLGEDGPQGVCLTPGHMELQRHALELRQRGIFLALVSRNERADVEALFRERQDYPLRWDDFSAIEVSWNDKASALKRIAHTLRIGEDAILFVDDNPGEQASVAHALPGVSAVLAHPDGMLTSEAVRYYPGVWRWRSGEDDAKRIRDLQAHDERTALAATVADTTAYFTQLQARLTYRNNPIEQLDRLAELCHKTNQFNLALRRLNQADIAKLLQATNACVTSVQLDDRLADSGIIAVIAAERHARQLWVRELCVSCRALGRGLEDTIVLTALRHMPLFDGCDEIIFDVQQGPRNQPALAWMDRLLSADAPPATRPHTLDASRLIAFTPAPGVTLVYPSAPPP